MSYSPAALLNSQKLEQGQSKYVNPSVVMMLEVLALTKTKEKNSKVNNKSIPHYFHSNPIFQKT